MESNWKFNNINIGTIRESSKANFSFEKVSDKEVQLISPTCGGCTKTNLKGNTLEVIFTTKKIPVHLRFNHTGKHITKFINIFYSDGTREQLSFNAKIVKK